MVQITKAGAEKLINRHQQYVNELASSTELAEMSTRIYIPLITKRKSEFLLDYLSRNGIDVISLEQRYENVDQKFRVARDEFEPIYSTQVLRKLEDMVDEYPTLICYFTELEPLSTEIDNDLRTRDVIEFLLEDLQGESRIEELRLQVSALDDVLRCKYRRNSEVIEQQRDIVEQVYLPERYWWRHPDQVLNED